MEISSSRFRSLISKRRRGLLSIVIVCVVVTAIALLWPHKRGDGDYITGMVGRGNVDVIVSATGTVQPVTTVEVGSQVSGTVSWLGADFRSEVKRGQVIARLDPALYQAQVDNQRANLANAEAAVQAAKSDIGNQDANLDAARANQDAARVASVDATDLLKRDQEMTDVIAGRDVEVAKAAADGADALNQQARAVTEQAQATLAETRTKLAEANAQVAQARAQLEQAKLDLDHSVITSPIDGVVISRNVDIGQTVAASLQAPTLFVIANDVTNMQVLASIDEANVGEIREGLTATFTIDAYPGDTFTGRISQVRLNAQQQQNVVTYSAVIDAANGAQKLLPGMTAYISVRVAHAEDVLTVPNAALRFVPDQLAALSGNPQGVAQDQTQGPASANGTPAGTADDVHDSQERTVWALDANKKLAPHSVTAGITNGLVTAIVSGDLNAGDSIVIGEI